MADLRGAEAVSAPQTLDLRPAAKWLGLAVAQTTLLGALLFYFGWVRTQSMLIQFGLDNTMLPLTVTDYVLRSANLAIRGTVVGLLGLSLALLALSALRGWLRARPRALRLCRRVLYACAAIFFVCGALGLLDAVVYSPRYPVVPLLVGAAEVSLLLGLTLRQARRPTAAIASSVGAWLTSALAVAVVACVFWAASTYAAVAGEDLSRSIEQNLTQRPRMTVFSTQDLWLGRPTQRSTDSEMRYRVRYSGLRLLMRAGGTYVLIPEGWVRGRDPVYLLRDSEDIRVEVTR